MGLLMTAFMWKLGFWKGRRLKVFFDLDQSVDIAPYVAKDGVIKIGQDEVHVGQKKHFLKGSGVPVDVLIRGNGKPIDVIVTNPPTPADRELNGLLKRYFESGYAWAESIYKNKQKDMLIMLLVIVAIVVGIGGAYMASQSQAMITEMATNGVKVAGEVICSTGSTMVAK